MTAVLSASAIADRQADNDKALMNAVLGSEVGSVQGLLVLGANPNARVVDEADRPGFWLKLRRFFGVRPRRANGLPVLSQAAVDGDAEIVKLLVDAGADTKLEDQYGWTALMWTARQRRADYIPLLVQHGSDVNHVAPDGESPLSFAVYSESYSKFANTTRILLENGANPNVRLPNGTSPLELCRKRQNRPLEQLLLRYGAK